MREERREELVKIIELERLEEMAYELVVLFTSEVTYIPLFLRVLLLVREELALFS
jgi:hypothetical protein